MINDPMDDIIADKNPDFKTPTEADFRKFNKIYTTRTLGKVVHCGHKLDLGEPPHNHCQSCWFCFFNERGEDTQILDQIFRSDGGKEELIRKHGKYFVKMFTKFMSTLAHWKAVAEAKESNG